MQLRHLALLMWLTTISVAQNRNTKPTLTHEENVVRAAYRNLSSAAQTGALWHAIESREGQSPNKNRIALIDAMYKPLRFELTDFKVGDVGQIRNAPSTSLVSGPDFILRAEYREVPVEVTTGAATANYNLVYADITWKQPLEPPSDSAEELRAHKIFTVKQFLLGLREPKRSGGWTRYAAYHVVATFGEHRVSYRATFLFSGGGATEEILAVDYATAMTVSPFTKIRECPSAVANTMFHEMPEAQAWSVKHRTCRCAETHQETGHSALPTNESSGNASLAYQINQCKRTIGRLPSDCAWDKTDHIDENDQKGPFSLDAGTIVKTRISDSKLDFVCTWICTRRDLSGAFNLRHGPWQLGHINLSRTTTIVPSAGHELENDRNQ
jgi:hypothetical protein